MNRILITMMSVAISLHLFSPTATADWDVIFEGAADHNYGYDVRQTSDGGYVVVGDYSVSYNELQMWLIKTDANGNMQWDQKFGGELVRDSGRCVGQTPDGGYIVVGHHIPQFFEGNVWLIKTDADGSQQWRKSFDMMDSDYPNGLQQTDDGGYIIGCYTYDWVLGPNGPTPGPGDIWLIKTDANGNLLWDRIFGGPQDDNGGYVQQTADGGYIISGSTHSFGAGGSDVWLIKTDANGIELWNRTFGGANSDGANSVKQTLDGGYIIAGNTYSYGAGGSDVWLIKTDADGTMQWNRTYGGGAYDTGKSVQQTADGRYLILGQTDSYGAGGYDILLIRTDEEGNEMWQRTFGGTIADLAKGSLQLTQDGGGIIVGSTASFGTVGGYDIWLVKLDDLCASFYRDTDGDSYGVTSDIQCLEDGASFPYTALRGGDCDDTDPDVHPGAQELCYDGIDNDCDSLVDEGTPEICDDGVDNDCDTFVDADDYDCCPDLTQLSCTYPWNGAVVYEPAVFTWDAHCSPDCHVFAVDLTLNPTFSWYWSTYENLHRPVYGNSWTMPWGLWSYIPSGSYVYWRVRGADLQNDPPIIITSEEVWWFYKW